MAKTRQKNFYESRRREHFPVEKPVDNTQTKLQKVLDEYRKKRREAVQTEGM